MNQASLDESHAQGPAARFREHARKVGDLTGWRRRGIAVLAGLCAAAALPPVHLLPLLVPAFSTLFLLALGAKSLRGALLDGWWFGLGYFTAGLYWIGIALFVDPKFIWMLPFATLGLAAVQAVFPAFAVGLVRWSGTRGWPALLLFTAAWAATEWLRGLAFSGFPWNQIGTVWAASDGVIQSAAIFGVLGLGIVTVLAAAAPVLLLLPAADAGPRAREIGWALLLLPALLWIGGMARLATVTVEFVPGVNLRIVQPNIPQKLKWQRKYRDANFRQHARLTRSPGYEKATHVIWPEAAVPFFLERDGLRRMQVAELAPASGSLITGTLRARGTGKTFRAWNSLLAVDRAAGIAAHYDKHHLVPFGEYVPYRELLKPFGVDKMTGGGSDYSRGPGPRTISIPGLPPVSPLICYEAIFSGRAVPPIDAGGPRPAWLLNITNDGWFGISSGPYQHFAAARLRAVEEGLPLVRAANTGISAIVDPYGRIVSVLGLGVQGVLDGRLPKPAQVMTSFARHGQSVPLILALLAGVIGRFSAHRFKLQSS